jgi:flagellar L-ring protein precursor FlgH
MRRSIVILVLLALFGVGCAVKTAPEKETEKFEYKPAKAEEKDEGQSRSGSLWRRNDEKKGLYSDIKAYERGDIVTVAIYESASANNEAETNTGQESTASASMGSLFGLEERIASINQGMDPTSLLNAKYANNFEGTGETSREGQLQATLTTRVVEVMPDGNLRIRGKKNITVNNESNLIELSGIVRPEDISARNTVDSKYVLNSDIEYKGRGVISDKQGQGWLVRFMDKVWPF